MSAESDARTLAKIRRTREQYPRSSFSLTMQGIDLMLRIADERDQLARDMCEEQQGRGRRPATQSEADHGDYVVRACAECGHAPHGVGMICWRGQCACRGNGGRS